MNHQQPASDAHRPFFHSGLLSCLSALSPWADAGAPAIACSQHCPSLGADISLRAGPLTQVVQLLALLISPAAAAVFCPTGQGLYHAEALVQSGLDDVEEAHGGPIQGFLYQGSSDLELGNHVEVFA